MSDWLYGLERLAALDSQASASHAPAGNAPVDGSVLPPTMSQPVEAIAAVDEPHDVDVPRLADGGRDWSVDDQYEVARAWFAARTNGQRPNGYEPDWSNVIRFIVALGATATFLAHSHVHFADFLLVSVPACIASVGKALQTGIATSSVVADGSTSGGVTREDRLRGIGGRALAALFAALSAARRRVSADGAASEDALRGIGARFIKAFLDELSDELRAPDDDSDAHGRGVADDADVERAQTELMDKLTALFDTFSDDLSALVHEQISPGTGGISARDALSGSGGPESAGVDDDVVVSPIQLAPPEPAEPDESAVRDESDSPRTPQISSPSDHDSLDDGIVHSSDAAGLSSSAVTDSPAALPPCDRQQLEASVFDLRAKPLRPPAQSEQVEKFVDARDYFSEDEDEPVRDDEDQPVGEDGWTIIAAPPHV